MNESLSPQGLGKSQGSFEISKQNLQDLLELSQGLWANDEVSFPMVVETLSAVALQELPPKTTIEKVVGVLTERAARQGAVAQASALDDPFFRLAPHERVLLIGLHRLHWSYERLSRALGRSHEEIEAIIWNARLFLAALVPVSDRRKALVHPTGTAGFSCPEYTAHRPWTQKFLDEEFSKRELLFLQNHMMACERCRTSLARCRDLYYRVEELIPQPRVDDRLVPVLQRVWRQNYQIRFKEGYTFGDHLRVIFGKRESWFVIVGMGVLIVYAFFHRAS